MKKKVVEYMETLGALVGPSILEIQNFQIETEIGICIVQIRYKTQKAGIAFIECKSAAREIFGNHRVELEQGGEDFFVDFKIFLEETLNTVNNHRNLL